MKKLLISILVSAFSLANAVRAEPLILEVDLEGALGVATAEYIIGGIEQAEERQAAALIISMDTPG